LIFLTFDFTGYACLFCEDFLRVGDRSESLQQSPLFKLGGTPILNLTKKQRDFVATIFQKMIEEQGADHTFKDDLIRNYINLIIHEVLKMQPSENFSSFKNAASRITPVFLELLERQFPIENTENSLQLKTA
jgi:AraC family transcriptional regulator, transcriptional activator of pobA